MRPEEREIIRQSLEGNGHPRVLDIGCGIGRHSSLVRLLSPGAEITVVEADHDLREHTVNAVAGAVSYEQIDFIPPGERFDIVFLLGNGLGIFGTERATRDGLRQIHGMLSERGCAIIESGTIDNGEFCEALHRIEYDGHVDGPFTWGYATRHWLERELAAAGFTVQSFRHSTRGGPFFIINATRG